MFMQMPHHHLHYSACFLLGPLKIFSTSFIHQWALSAPVFTSIFCWLYCTMMYKRNLVLQLLFCWTIWGQNFRTCFKWQGVHRFLMSFNPVKIQHLFIYLVFYENNSSDFLPEDKVFCWCSPSGNILDSRLFLTVQVDSAHALILLFSTNATFTVGPSWNGTGTALDAFENPVHHRGISLRVACALTWHSSSTSWWRAMLCISLSPEVKSEKEEHPPLLSFNLCSKVFVLSFTAPFRSEGKSATVRL